jgi:cholinesterase
MSYFLLSLLLPIAIVSAAAIGDNHNRYTEDSWHIGRGVRTTSGLVTGHPAPDASQVSEYLGIPYAKPPVGELRFATPVAYVNHGIVDGSNFVSYQNTTSSPSPAVADKGPKVL